MAIRATHAEGMRRSGLDRNGQMRILSGYGVVLMPLEHADIEMMRCWRNDPKVFRFMYYREYITPEMQEAWFASIENRAHAYFIVHIDGHPVGVTDYKQIDYDRRTAEGGIFIHDERYQNGLYAYAILAVKHAYGFNELGLQTLFANILDDNPRAIRFNKSLGYKPTETVVGGVKRLYVLTRDDYYKNFERYRRLLEESFDDGKECT